MSLSFGLQVPDPVGLQGQLAYGLPSVACGSEVLVPLTTSFNVLAACRTFVRAVIPEVHEPTCNGVIVLLELCLGLYRVQATDTIVDGGT
jgi:hypothetical protein